MYGVIASRTETVDPLETRPDVVGRAEDDLLEEIGRHMLRAGEGEDLRVGTRTAERPEVEVLVGAEGGVEALSRACERRWIQDEPIEEVVRLTNEAECVLFHQGETGLGQAVELPVLPSEFVRRARRIHLHDSLGAAVCRVDREPTCEAEQVQQVEMSAVASYQSPVVTLVQIEPGLLAAEEVDRITARLASFG